MKHLYFTLVASSLFLLQSCSKGDINDPLNPNAPDCVRENYGTLTIDNNQYWPQRIFINDLLEDTLDGFYMQAFKVPPGDYKIKYERYIWRSNAVQPVDSQYVVVNRCTDVRMTVQ